MSAACTRARALLPAALRPSRGAVFPVLLPTYTATYSASGGVVAESAAPCSARVAGPGAVVSFSLLAPCSAPTPVDQDCCDTVAPQCWRGLPLLWPAVALSAPLPRLGAALVGAFQAAFFAHGAPRTLPTPPPTMVCQPSRQSHSSASASEDASGAVVVKTEATTEKGPTTAAVAFARYLRRSLRNYRYVPAASAPQPLPQHRYGQPPPAQARGGPGSFVATGAVATVAARAAAATLISAQAARFAEAEARRQTRRAARLARTGAQSDNKDDSSADVNERNAMHDRDSHDNIDADANTYGDAKGDDEESTSASIVDDVAVESNATATSAVVAAVAAAADCEPLTPAGLVTLLGAAREHLEEAMQIGEDSAGAWAPVEFDTLLTDLDASAAALHAPGADCTEKTRAREQEIAQLQLGEREAKAIAPSVARAMLRLHPRLRRVLGCVTAHLPAAASDFSRPFCGRCRRYATRNAAIRTWHEFAAVHSRRGATSAAVVSQLPLALLQRMSAASTHLPLPASCPGVCPRCLHALRWRWRIALRLSDPDTVGDAAAAQTTNAARAAAVYGNQALATAAGSGAGSDGDGAMTAAEIEAAAAAISAAMADEALGGHVVEEPAVEAPPPDAVWVELSGRAAEEFFGLSLPAADADPSAAVVNPSAVANAVAHDVLSANPGLSEADVTAFLAAVRLSTAETGENGDTAEVDDFDYVRLLDHCEPDRAAAAAATVVMPSASAVADAAQAAAARAAGVDRWPACDLAAWPSAVTSGTQAQAHTQQAAESAGLALHRALLTCMLPANARDGDLEVMLSEAQHHHRTLTSDAVAGETNCAHGVPRGFGMCALCVNTCGHGLDCRCGATPATRATLCGRVLLPPGPARPGEFALRLAPRHTVADSDDDEGEGAHDSKMVDATMAAKARATANANAHATEQARVGAGTKRAATDAPDLSRSAPQQPQSQGGAKQQHVQLQRPHKNHEIQPYRHLNALMAAKKSKSKWAKRKIALTSDTARSSGAVAALNAVPLGALTDVFMAAAAVLLPPRAAATAATTLLRAAGPEGGAGTVEDARVAGAWPRLRWRVTDTVQFVDGDDEEEDEDEDEDGIAYEYEDDDAAADAGLNMEDADDACDDDVDEDNIIPLE